MDTPSIDPELAVVECLAWVDPKTTIPDRLSRFEVQNLTQVQSPGPQNLIIQCFCMTKSSNMRSFTDLYIVYRV